MATYTATFDVGDIVYLKKEAERGKLVKAQVEEIIVSQTHGPVACPIVRYAICCNDAVFRGTRWLEVDLVAPDEAYEIAKAALHKKAVELESQSQKL